MKGSNPRVPTELLAADFKAGLKTSEIAEKHDMGRETVRWRLNRWKPGCVASRPRPVPQRCSRPVPPAPSSGPTYVCADDGKFYQCSILWLLDWACLSFHGGQVELLVAVDGGRLRRAINDRKVPITIGEIPLVGVRVFPDPNGVRRTWRAYEAQPAATVRGFPRRLIPRDQAATTSPDGALLWRCGVHEQHMRLLELRSAS